jgi:hypothetical protein
MLGASGGEWIGFYLSGDGDLADLALVVGAVVEVLDGALDRSNVGFAAFQIGPGKGDIHGVIVGG